TRPAGARLELRLRAEQGLTAADAHEGARLLAAVVFAGPGHLRAFAARDAVLLRRQQLLPFGFRLLDFRLVHVILLRGLGSALPTAEPVYYSSAKVSWQRA